MGIFSIVWGIHQSPVNTPHKGQWRGALVFSLICAWINRWVDHREAGDLRRHGAHYDVIVMTPKLPIITPITNRPIFIRWINCFIWIFRRDTCRLKLRHCYTKHSISSTYDCLDIFVFSTGSDNCCPRWEHIPKLPPKHSDMNADPLSWNAFVM